MNGDTTFECHLVTEDQLKETLDITKSAALGYLGTRIVQDAFGCLTIELTHVYNFCMDHSVFPEEWGIGIVSHIPKTKSKKRKTGDP